MTETQYMVVFNPLDPRFDAKAIKSAIRAEPRVTHWWNHLPNCFILTANVSARRLSKTLRQAAAGTSFIVTEIDLRNSEGLLPSVSWDWIKEREQEKFAANADAV